MFDKSSVGRNRLGKWIGAFPLLGEPRESSELPVLSWDLFPAVQCWDGPAGAWDALKAAPNLPNLLIFK